MFIKNVTNNKVSDVLFSYSLPDPNRVLTTGSNDWYDWCLEADSVEVESNTVDETNIVETEPVDNESENLESRGLPIIIGNRPPNPSPEPRPPPSVKTIKRSNKALKALSLPNLWGANHRSLWPRLENTLDELVELEAHVGFHCEVWENKENEIHALEIQKSYEIRGVQYISTARPDRIGGRCCIDTSYWKSILSYKTYTTQPETTGSLLGNVETKTTYK